MTTAPASRGGPPAAQALTVVLAGATGDLGLRVARALDARGGDAVQVRALVRPGTSPDRLGALAALGATPVGVDYDDHDALRRACEGAAVVVSTLSGLRPVVVDAQTALLRAAVDAGVPRFVPSDYSADHTGVPAGTNRNLELRRDFRRVLDAAPVRATSVLVGAFTDLLTGDAPIVLPRLRRVLYWSDADQVLDLTTKDDTASYVADVALDPYTPRVLQVAGDQVTARDLARTMSEVTGTSYRLTYAGPTRLVRAAARAARALTPSSEDLYPAWQGMQYLDTMFSGDGALTHLSNDRYGSRPWTSARDVLTLAATRTTP